VSPRFGILLLSMMLSISFIILDCLSVTSVLASNLPDGLNPFWKLAFVFKCFTDTIILDDFKTALDKLQAHRMGRISGATDMAGTAASVASFTPPPAAAPFKADDEESEPLPGPASPSGQNPAEYEAAEFAEPAADVDIEAQLKYWDRHDGSTSTATR
jgi:hypothetical protein